MKRFMFVIGCILLISLFPITTQAENPVPAIASECDGGVIKGDAEQIVNSVNDYFQMEWTQSEISERIPGVEEMLGQFDAEICDLREYFAALLEALSIPVTDDVLQELINDIYEPRNTMGDETLPADNLMVQGAPLLRTAPYQPLPPLHDKVIIFVVFLNTPGGGVWDIPGQQAAVGIVDFAALRLMQSAPAAANLNISRLNYGPIAVSGPKDDWKPQNDMGTWMKEALQRINADLNTNFITIEELGEEIADAYGARTVYVIFMINEEGQPALISGGGVTGRGAIVMYYHACILGICVPVPWTIYVHESLHYYGAKDEYKTAPTCMDTSSCDANSYHYSWGYQNTGCDHCDIFPHVMSCAFCITDLPSASTSGMVGWGDHDGDTILDPDDFCPYTAGTSAAPCNGCPETTCNDTCEIAICDSDVLDRHCHNNQSCDDLARSGPVCEDICTTFYRDADGDRYGDPAITMRSVTQPAGYVINPDDCNDADAAINPAAAEICNNVDDNCNSSVDEGVPPVPMTCGIGECLADGLQECTNGQMVDNCTPGQPSGEICDGLDNDCDGESDEGGYDFSDFLPPLNPDGSSTFKAGRTVPVRVSLSDCDGQTVQAASLNIHLEMITNGSAAAVPVQSSGKSNSGSLFRYDEESGQYVYNLKTKGLAAGTYGVTGMTETGVSHSVGFSLR